MRNAVKNPAKLKHIAPTVAYVKHCGGETIEIRQTGHINIGWSFDGAPLSIAVPVSPRNVDNAITRARQQIRRVYREHGVEMRA